MRDFSLSTGDGPPRGRTRLHAPARARVWLLLAAACLLLAVAAGSRPEARQPGDPKSEEEETEQRKPVGVGEEIQFFILDALDPETGHGKRVNIREYLDGGSRPARAILLSFYAVWCEPCQRELPFLRALHERYASQGLQIFIVSIDEKDEGKEAQLRRQVYRDGPLPFPVLRDRLKIVYWRFRLGALPAVYLVDPDGRVRFFVDGFKPEVKQRIDAEVRSMIAGARG